MITVYKAIQIECDYRLSNECKFRKDGAYREEIVQFWVPHKSLTKKHLKQYNLTLLNDKTVICEYCKKLKI